MPGNENTKSGILQGFSFSHFGVESANISCLTLINILNFFLLLSSNIMLFNMLLSSYFT